MMKDKKNRSKIYTEEKERGECTKKKKKKTKENNITKPNRSKNYTPDWFLVRRSLSPPLHIICLFNKIIFKQYIVNDVEIYKRV